MPKAKAAATRALEIDPALAEAHNAMAGIYNAYEYDWPRAERECRQSIALNPNGALPHLYYGMLLTMTRRFEKAIGEIRMAQQLDPLSSYIEMRGLSLEYFMRPSGHRDITEHRKLVELNPNSSVGQMYLGRA